MVGLLRRFYWPIVINVYWLCTLWLLFKVSPISVDGSGPSVTFYWGNHPPTPTLAEYDRSVGARLPFLYPYWVAASVITFLGCGLTTWVVRLCWPKRSHLFLVSSATALVSLLLGGVISDVGIASHIWKGPTIYGGLSYLWPFLKILVPVSLLAGVLALVRDHLAMR
jgi:hypothetical protein